MDGLVFLNKFNNYLFLFKFYIISSEFFQHDLFLGVFGHESTVCDSGQYSASRRNKESLLEYVVISNSAHNGRIDLPGSE